MSVKINKGTLIPTVCFNLKSARPFMCFFNSKGFLSPIPSDGPALGAALTEHLALLLFPVF